VNCHIKERLAEIEKQKEEEERAREQKEKEEQLSKIQVGFF
jgi:hypothetical protein